MVEMYGLFITNVVFIKHGDLYLCIKDAPVFITNVVFIKH